MVRPIVADPVFSDVDAVILALAPRAAGRVVTPPRSSSRIRTGPLPTTATSADPAGSGTRRTVNRYLLGSPTGEPGRTGNRDEPDRHEDRQRKATASDFRSRSQSGRIDKVVLPTHYFTTALDVSRLRGRYVSYHFRWSVT